MSTVSATLPESALVPPAIILPPDLHLLVSTPLHTLIPSCLLDGEGGLVSEAQAWLHNTYLRQVFVYERADEAIVYELDSARAPSNAVVKNICLLCDHKSTCGRFDRHVGSEAHRRKIVDALHLKYGPPSIVYTCQANGCDKQFYRDDLCSEHVRTTHHGTTLPHCVKLLRARTEMPKASKSNRVRRMRKSSVDNKRPLPEPTPERPTKRPKIGYPDHSNSSDEHLVSAQGVPPSPTLSSSSSTSSETSPPTTPTTPPIALPFTVSSSLGPSIAMSSEMICESFGLDAIEGSQPASVLSISDPKAPCSADSASIELPRDSSPVGMSKTEAEPCDSPIATSHSPAVADSSAAATPESPSLATNTDVVWTADAVAAVIELLAPSAMEFA